MKPHSATIYPGISDILGRKAEGRRDLAKRSFAEKLDILEAMRARAEPFRKAREARRKEPAAPPNR